MSKSDKILIDYQEFLDKRFDLVLTYHLLNVYDFDYELTHKALVKGDYRFLEEAFSILRTRYEESIYPIRVKTWQRMDVMARDDKAWEAWHIENPYILTVEKIGVNIKRFILALRYKRRLFWVITTKFRRINIHVKAKMIWKRQSYEEILSPSQFRLFAIAMESMLTHMGELEFFSEATLLKDECRPPWGGS